jgi:hypothetical protein
MRYSRQVLSEAWKETKSPFNLSKKTAVAVLTAIGTILFGYFHGDFINMPTVSARYFWIGQAPFSAAPFLFACNVIEGRAKFYFDLDYTKNTVINDLRYTIAWLESDKPYYAAVRLQHQYSVMAASRLWSDVDPDAQKTSDSRHGTIPSCPQFNAAI